LERSISQDRDDRDEYKATLDRIEFLQLTRQFYISNFYAHVLKCEDDESLMLKVHESRKDFVKQAHAKCKVFLKYTRAKNLSIGEHVHALIPLLNWLVEQKTETLPKRRDILETYKACLLYLEKSGEQH